MRFLNRSISASQWAMLPSFGDGLERSAFILSWWSLMLLSKPAMFLRRSLFRPTHERVYHDFALAGCDSSVVAAGFSAAFFRFNDMPVPHAVEPNQSVS